MFLLHELLLFVFTFFGCEHIFFNTKMTATFAFLTATQNLGGKENFNREVHKPLTVIER